MSSNKRNITPEEAVIKKEYQQLLDANQGWKAVAYLKSNLSKSVHGDLELALANFYISKGQGGVTVEQDQGYSWLVRAAEKSPFFWYHVGNAHASGIWGIEENQTMAAHIWAKGTSRGCAICASVVSDYWEGSRTGVTVSLEDAYIYTVFALDIGQGNKIWKRLDKILDSLPENPTGILAEAAKLKALAISYAGSSDWDRGGLPKAAFETYRTGFVSEEVWLTDALIEAGDFGQAIINLNHEDNLFGRSNAAQYNKLFLTAELEKPGFFKPEDMRLAKVSALIFGGDLRHAMAVADVYMSGYRMTTNYKDGKTVELYDRDKGFAFFDVARANGTYDADLAEAMAIARAPRVQERYESEAISDFHDCTNSWRQENLRNRMDTKLANGKEIRNMGFMAACENQFMEAYAYIDNNPWLQGLSDEHSGWLSALNMDRTNWEKRQQRAADLRHNLRYSGVNTWGSGGAAPTNSAPASTISSADAYANAAKNTCSWSMNTSHLCK